MPSKRIRIGHITVACLPPKDSLVRADTDAGPYMRAVAELSNMLGPDNWALAGGLVIPISVGSFYRRHTDIDIVMPLARLCDVVDAFRTHGYELYTNWTVSHRSRGIVLQCRVRSDGGMIRCRARRLYVKRTDGGEDRSLLGKIDLYPFYDRGQHLETCNTHRVLPVRAMQHSSLAPFHTSGHVRCLHVANVVSLKLMRSGAKHRLDCAVIRDGPDAARQWFRRLAVGTAGPAGRASPGAAP